MFKVLGTTAKRGSGKSKTNMQRFRKGDYSCEGKWGCTTDARQGKRKHAKDESVENVGGGGDEYGGGGTIKGRSHAVSAASYWLHTITPPLIFPTFQYVCINSNLNLQYNNYLYNIPVLQQRTVLNCMKNTTTNKLNFMSSSIPQNYNIGVIRYNQIWKNIAHQLISLLQTGFHLFSQVVCAFK